MSQSAISIAFQQNKSGDGSAPDPSSVVKGRRRETSHNSD